LRTALAEPPAEPIESVTVGDRLEADALTGYTWTVIRVWDFGGRRMVSLRWRNALILRDESALRESREGWRKA
jgi:hypothetical protein